MPPQRFETSDGHNLILNIRRESIVVMEDERVSYTFDRAGRLAGAFDDGLNYRRSMDNRILEKRQTGAGGGLQGRARRFLSPAEVQAVEARAYEYVRRLPDRVAGPLSAHTLEALAPLNGYSYARLEREREQFTEIYKPVTILPPDQYLALYLQATEGCPYNECTFCGFYRDRRFRVKTGEEFREHVRAVKQFFGAGLSLRRSLFLGDANALMLPQAKLAEFFEVLNDEFELLPTGLEPRERREWERAHPISFRGVYSFIDAFTTRRKTAREFSALARRGLRRAYLGLESGDRELLKALGKPSTPEDVVQVVNVLKKGGVSVGLVILIGAGGARYADAHVQATAELVNQLPLDGNDIIYFSELVDYPGSTYSALAEEAGWGTLTGDEIKAQEKAMRGAFVLPARRPTISYYDIREFLY
jgi:radical SAM superfamily enzyme YgiQ (UPF0313 family)